MERAKRCQMDGERMSYKIVVSGVTFTEKSKDDVIARLIALFSDNTLYPIKVTWPDGQYIEYEGEE